MDIMRKLGYVKMKDYQDLLNKLTDTKLKLEVTKLKLEVAMEKLKEREENNEKDSNPI